MKTFCSALAKIHGVRWKVTIFNGVTTTVFELHAFDNAWTTFRMAVHTGNVDRAEIEPVR